MNLKHTRSTRHVPSGEFFRKGKNGTEQWTQYLKRNAKVNAFSAILCNPQDATELVDRQQRTISLLPEGRRLLLGASIRLLSHRFACGKPILKDDVVRVASLADDAMGRAA